MEVEKKPTKRQEDSEGKWHKTKNNKDVMCVIKSNNTHSMCVQTLHRATHKVFSFCSVVRLAVSCRASIRIRHLETKDLCKNTHIHIQNKNLFGVRTGEIKWKSIKVTVLWIKSSKAHSVILNDIFFSFCEMCKFVFLTKSNNPKYNKTIKKMLVLWSFYLCHPTVFLPLVVSKSFTVLRKTLLVEYQRQHCLN